MRSRRLERRQLVARDDGGDRIADEADAIDRERVLVLADRQDAVGDREVLAGQDEVARRDARARAMRRSRTIARVRHASSAAACSAPSAAASHRRRTASGR